jgi:hypothetical protein
MRCRSNCNRSQFVISTSSAMIQTTFAIKQDTLYVAYALEFDAPANGGCRDEALNNLADQIRERTAARTTGRPNILSCPMLSGSTGQLPPSKRSPQIPFQSKLTTYQVKSGARFRSCSPSNNAH